MMKTPNTRFNLTFVLSRKLLGRSLLQQLPFLCNFRANFAAAKRVGKGPNAGQANVRCTPFGGQERRLFTHKDKCGKYISVIIERRKGRK